MNYDNLSDEQKQELKQTLNDYASKLGGVNALLTLIEKIKNTKPNALMNKQATFKSDDIIITWEKSIFKDTLTNLFNAIKNEDKTGDILKGLAGKDYKNTMTMMKILKPIIITVQPKDESLEALQFPILDTSIAKNTKISFIFKVLFFYNVSIIKKAINYKVD
jgi:hypothetical protein